MKKDSDQPTIVKKGSFSSNRPTIADNYRKEGIVGPLDSDRLTIVKKGMLDRYIPTGQWP